MSAATNLRTAAEAIAADTPDVKVHETLAAALVAAKSELKAITASQKASIPTKAGGSFTYDFANLADCCEAVDAVLARHGLAQFTPVHAFEGRLACTVEVLHETGQEKRYEPFPFPEGHDAQATGSMVTYHRRYALLAALGLAVRSDDNDGATAKAAAPERTTSKHPLRSEVEALTDGEKVWQHFLGKAGIEDPDADRLLASNDGWRNWLTAAIAAHKAPDDPEAA